MFDLAKLVARARRHDRPRMAAMNEKKPI